MKGFIYRILTQRKHPVYSKALFYVAARYVDFCYGDNNFNRETNGEFALLRRIIPRSRVVFDVGTNVGDYAAEIMKIRNDVSIHAFEPDERAYEKLKARGLYRTNNVALGEKKARAPLFRHKDRTVFNSLLDIHDKGSLGSTADVVVDTVDDYCRREGVGHIDFIKVDVEGAELAVFKGARNTLEKGAIDFLQFEFSGASAFAKTFLKDFIDLFSKYGYDLYRIKPLSIEKIVYYPDQERFTLANFVAIRSGLPIDFLRVTEPFYY